MVWGIKDEYFDKVYPHQKGGDKPMADPVRPTPGPVPPPPHPVHPDPHPKITVEELEKKLTDAYVAATGKQPGADLAAFIHLVAVFESLRY